ncbi:AraC family transcriptional regulator [Fulvivirgaceae bacterium BMA10]|uniref:AraC family transcriptional regulator n=1 Tax=Splendidivirga corallicola TaxID=3051826 RepID=A0ABT8KH43_9BACT|nr:AraC family transcriptional regulator [Fulvivirgaceae bacterium BMA10]
MILNAFPDIQWLKKQIENKFEDRTAWNGKKLEQTGWPNVILNVKTTNSYRPDIIGPLSLFTNFQGESYCSVNQKKTKISEGYYFLSNESQSYSFEIDNTEPTETFNVHFGEHFCEKVHASLVNADDRLLNDVFNKDSVPIYYWNKLYARDPHIDAILRYIQAEFDHKQNKQLFLEEQLSQLLTLLLCKHRNVLKQIRRLPPSKKSTKIEVYKRISIAVDYMHSGYHMDIQLDDLAGVACLSKYHFLRLFKALQGCSPHQYLTKLRIEKGKELLAKQDQTIKEIALQLGFENASSFSRTFFKNTRVYPTQYRPD